MAHPRKWEYDVDDNLGTGASAEEVVEHLDAMGAEGWELVAMQKQGSLYRLVYKRPIRGGDDYEDDGEYGDDDYEDDEDYNEDDYDEDGSIRVNPPPPEEPKGFWGRR